MNKVLHVLVYVFLVLAGVALFFEYQLNAKRTELTDRNKRLRDCIFQVANTIEKADPQKDVATINKDVSAVEAEIVDSPDMENLLDDYPAELEKQNLETYSWKDSDMGLIESLRQIYQLDPEGNPIREGDDFVIAGSNADKKLNQLFDSAKKQQARLNNTRKALTDIHGKLENVVGELNKLKGEARQDKVTIVERDKKISELEGIKADLEDQVTRKNSQIDELNGENASLKDEIANKDADIEVAKEEIAKQIKLVEQLKKMMKEMVPTAGQRGEGNGIAVESLPIGDKGVIISADNENMFAIVKFTDEAMKELKGEELTRPLPAIELGVRRPGFNKGDTGEFVGRIKLRQEVKGKNYVICDILSAWEQDKLNANDVIFAD